MQRLPNTITVGDKTRVVSVHLQRRAAERPELTAENLRTVLGDWVIRGVRTDLSGRLSMVYMGWVGYDDRNRLMRVAVSMDDRVIITAVLDGTATDKIEGGDWDYFRRHYTELETRQ